MASSGESDPRLSRALDFLAEGIVAEDDPYTLALTMQSMDDGGVVALVQDISERRQAEQTKALLETSYGFVPWDDAHHPKLSQTEGVADGRWLFINGNNTPRVARINLATFETDAAHDSTLSSTAA